MSTWTVALLAGLAAALALPPRAPMMTVRAATPTRSETGWMVRMRLPLAGLAGLGAALFLGGPIGLAAAPLAATGCWIAIERAEPAAVRRRRELVSHDLPHVTRLFASALSAGVAPADGLRVVAEALPGPATATLLAAVTRLELGADPVEAWHGLGENAPLAPLGRTLARAHATGGSVAAAVTRLADELSRDARGAAEQRARTVGVKAAVPLGLCLLPGFLLIGVVPLVGGLLSSLGL